MHGWIDPFYEPAAKAIEPGHIWCDQPIYMPPRHGLKITRVNPDNDTDLDYEVCGRTFDTFDHPPIHSLKLESTEGLVVAQTKRNRPVIVLGGTAATELRPSDTRHVDSVFVVPVYGADQFDAHVRRRISYYDFTNAFYLPEWARPEFEEGFARLDHAQAVSQSSLTDHRGLKLASDALDALVEWFVGYATGRLPDDSIILDFRREMLATGGA
jgi:hypothetical protein